MAVTPSAEVSHAPRPAGDHRAEPGRARLAGRRSVSPFTGLLGSRPAAGGVGWGRQPANRKTTPIAARMVMLLIALLG